MSWLSVLLRSIGVLPPKPAPVTPAPPVPPGSNSLLAEINHIRAGAGLKPFPESGCLSTQAQRWAAELRQRGTLTHEGFQGRLGACGIQAGGEVIAAGQQTPREAAIAWRNSPGHWSILSSDYQFCGAGSDGGYWCAMAGDAARFTVPLEPRP